ncbi:hypothetical protein ES708_16199 [subsurface metagenome]
MKNVGGWNRGLTKETDKRLICSKVTKRKISKNHNLKSDLNLTHKNKKSKEKSKNTIKEKMKLGYLPTISGWWKGKKHTREHNAKISEAHIGMKYTEEHNRKMSEIRKGIPCPEERKKNISKALKGRIIGEEWRKKISTSHKENLLKNPERLKKMLRRRIPTSLEEKFQKIIEKHGLPYKYVGDGKFFIERYNPDFINTNNEKIAVEVYARYYKLRNDKSIDKWKEDRQKVFNRYGWKIIFFNEVEVNEKNVLEKI